MNITADRLPDQLARGLAALYVVVGDEPLAAQGAGDAIRAAARAREQVSEYLLSCLYMLAGRVVAEQNSVRSLTGAKKELEDALLDIRSSTAWKAVLSFRRAWARIAPADSRRGRMLRQLAHFVLSLGGMIKRKQSPKVGYPVRGTTYAGTRAGNAKS